MAALVCAAFAAEAAGADAGSPPQAARARRAPRPVAAATNPLRDTDIWNS
ncbi:hypothetical protein [Nonomuraea recticatena]